MPAQWVLLAALGEHSNHPQVAQPSLSLSSLDARTLHLQTNSIEISTIKAYATGAKDYIQFCLCYPLPLTPMPKTLSQYLAYTSLSIASGPKYLTGAQHFLIDLYPDFDNSRAHPLVQSAIRGSKKLQADPVHRKQPLQLSHLQAFLHIADISGKYNDLLFATLISWCFYRCHHSGELVWKNDKSQWDWQKVIKHCFLSFFDNHA